MFTFNLRVSISTLFTDVLFNFLAQSFFFSELLVSIIYHQVRWQHEEDQEECNSCKQRFSAVGRRKVSSFTLLTVLRNCICI